MNLLKYCSAWLVIAASAIGQTLNWTELARRPELWPAECVSKTEMKFDGGVTIKAGQKLTVLQVSGNEVQVQTLDGRTTFAAEPDETDTLAAAQAAYATLTPKQRALTYQTLVAQKDAWPRSVVVKKKLELAPGKVVQAGDQVLVLDVLPDRVAVKSDALNANFQVAVQATDVMAQARKLVENPSATPRFVDAAKAAQPSVQVAQEKKRDVGPVISELEPELISSVTGKAAPLDENALPKYIVLYRGSSTCPITRQFTPTLIKYYQQTKPAHPEFEIVYMMTESVEDTNKFAKEIGFSWRAIKYEHSHPMPNVLRPIQGLLPQLVVLDRNGRVLANGWQNSASNALKQLDALLKAPAGAQ